MTDERDLLRIHPDDDVAVALRDLRAGETARGGAFQVPMRQDVPRAHKVALRRIGDGEGVTKYGACIGLATCEIAPGEWVHVHNLATALSGTLEYTYEPAEPAVVEAPRDLTFEGFRRGEGTVGVRNEVWIVPTVGCVNSLAEALAAAVRDEGVPSGVDAVHAFRHPFGCSQLGEDLEATRRLLAGLVRHPNAGGVLVLGLGCEDNTMDAFRRAVGESVSERVRYLVAQDVADEFAAGKQMLVELARGAARLERASLPLRRLRVGLKCGASDAFSGITANPVVGAVADMLAAAGASVVLTEVPEVFGAEQALLRRCASRAVFEQCARMINAFKRHFLSHRQSVSENPSPGNRAGGITTLEEKSLGCIQKGGGGPVTDVLDYAGQLRRPGLSLLNGPGNDLVSATNLVAAGCQLILFTTGRGNPLGTAVPVVKISTTSELAARKAHWIDFDAGPVLEGEPLEDVAARLLRLLREVACGRPTRAEEAGSREIAVWHTGVTL